MLQTKLTAAAFAVLTATTLISISIEPSAQASSGPGAPAVVASGLNNPRGLQLAGDLLLVGEAGTGGSTVVANPDGSLQGFGYTGSIAAVLRPQHGTQRTPARVVTGLFSGASATSSPGQPAGSAAGGSDDMALSPDGQLAIVETTYANAPASFQAQAGKLLLAGPHGQLRQLADITGYEKAHDPDGQGFDSNPYAVISFRGGWLVADAAGNDLLRVDPHGKISVFTVFPNILGGPCAGQSDPTPAFPGCNFVPDALAVDRAGNIYVAGLGSLVPGAGEVIELDPSGHRKAAWTGFNSVTGVAVGLDGSLYVSQLFANPTSPSSFLPGVLTRVHGSQQTSVDVPFPCGVVVDQDNNVFVAAYSISPGSGNGTPGGDTSGQIWRLRF